MQRGGTASTNEMEGNKGQWLRKVGQDQVRRDVKTLRVFGKEMEEVGYTMMIGALVKRKEKRGGMHQRKTKRKERMEKMKDSEEGGESNELKVKR